MLLPLFHLIIPKSTLILLSEEQLIKPQYTVHERCWIIQKYFQTYGTGRGGGYSLKDAMADFVQHLELFTT